MKKKLTNQNKRKLLYLMHVDWDWIFQRPHVLALRLSEYFKLKLVYNFTLIGRKHLKFNVQRPSWISHTITLPRYYKYPVIRWLNKKIFDFCIWRDKPASFDVIWICYPTYYPYIPKNYEGVVVYDCMDDHTSMMENITVKKEIEKLEKLLIDRAEIVFTSSLVLQNNIRQLTQNTGKVLLLRNGYIDKIWHDASDTGLIKEDYKIGYIGTVAGWFDFELLKNNLQTQEHISYHIVGPCSIAHNIQNEKIIFEGAIKFDQLYDKVIKFDCLIMPFQVNDIIKAVDPVKLYEYISYGKCIIAVYYPEIERFSDFVYFYETQEEYNNLISEKIRDGFKPKYNKEQQHQFISQNSWDIRCAEAIRIIGQYDQ